MLQRYSPAIRNPDTELETSIYPSGKILVKTKDIETAMDECERIRGIIG